MRAVQDSSETAVAGAIQVAVRSSNLIATGPTRATASGTRAAGPTLFRDLSNTNSLSTKTRKPNKAKGITIINPDKDTHEVGGEDDLVVVDAASYRETRTLSSSTTTMTSNRPTLSLRSCAASSRRLRFPMAMQRQRARLIRKMILVTRRARVSRKLRMMVSLDMIDRRASSTAFPVRLLKDQKDATRERTGGWSVS